MDQLPSFWRWMFQKNGGQQSGIRSLIDKWFYLHICIGFLGSMLIDTNFVESAKSTIIPFASILTGITFAWSGNITALLTTKEISKLSKYHKDGISSYVFSVQRSILIIFTALLLWVFSSLDIVNNFYWRFLVFTNSSIAVRESWGVIMFAQMLTIYRERVACATAKDKHSKKNDDHTDKSSP